MIKTEKNANLESRFDFTKYTLQINYKIDIYFKHVLTFMNFFDEKILNFN